jgi:hypothetical protein
MPTKAELEQQKKKLEREITRLTLRRNRTRERMNQENEVLRLIQDSSLPASPGRQKRHQSSAETCTKAIALDQRKIDAALDSINDINRQLRALG